MLLALDQRHADGQIILDPWQPHHFGANEPVRIPGEISRSLWTLCSRKLQAGVEQALRTSPQKKLTLLRNPRVRSKQNALAYIMLMAFLKTIWLAAYKKST